MFCFDVGITHVEFAFKLGSDLEADLSWGELLRSEKFASLCWALYMTKINSYNHLKTPHFVGE